MSGIRSVLMDFNTDIFSLDRPSKVTFNLVGSKLPNSKEKYIKLSRVFELVDGFGIFYRNRRR